MFDTDVLLPEDPAESRYMAETLRLDLDQVPTGLMLAAVLARIDRDQLSGLDRVTVLKARNRLKAWVDAELLADVDSVTEAIGELPPVPGSPHDVYDTTAIEIGAALSLT